MEEVGPSVYMIVNNKKMYIDTERSRTSCKMTTEVALQDSSKRDRKKPELPCNKSDDQWSHSSRTPIWNKARNKPQMLINQSATRLLLSYMRKYWKKSLSEEKSGSRFWNKIAAYMISADYFLGENPGARCHRKWMSMKRIYNKYELEKHKMNAQELVLSKPPFYKEIQTIVEGQKRSESMNQVCEVSESVPGSSPTTYYACPSSSSDDERSYSHDDPARRLQIMARKKRSPGRSSLTEKFIELIVQSTTVAEEYRAKKERRLQIQIKGRNAAKRKRHQEKMEAINKLTNAIVALLSQKS